MVNEDKVGLFGNLRLATKISAGFAVMILLLAAAISFSLYQVTRVEYYANRMADVRVPTSEASLGMLNGVNESLSGLRGWMLLGEEKFKEERAHAWNEWIDKNLRSLHEYSRHWTNSEDIQRLRQIEAGIATLRKYQQEIEDIANTAAQTPAEKRRVESLQPKAHKLEEYAERMLQIENDQEANTTRKQILFYIAEIETSITLADGVLREFMLEASSTARKDFDKHWENNTRYVNKLGEYYAHLTAQQRSLLESFKNLREDYHEEALEIIEARASKQYNLANYWLGSKATPIAIKIVALLEELVLEQEKLLEADARVIEDLIINLENIEWTLLAAGVAIAILLATLITRLITRPILSLVEAVRHIAANRDLTISVPVSGRDEIGVMAGAFNNMMEVIRNAFTVVSHTAGDVYNNAKDVAQRAGGNRKRAEEELKRSQTSEKVITEMGSTAGQVSEAAKDQQEGAQVSLSAVQDLLQKMQTVAESAKAQEQETSTTMSRVTEMGQTSAKVVATAEQQGEMVTKVTGAISDMVNSVEEMRGAVGEATEYGRAALAAAEEGHSSVVSTVKGMKAISESSEQISEIIDVITEIAEQTNLLALNAAVEAARAGAHGKGFAVVADEVGKLAQRSSEAAKEITQLIKDSAQNVSEGVKLTDQSQQALAKIDESGRVNIKAIEAISATAELLNSSTGEVSNLVQELNKLATSITTMAGEQGARRQAAEAALQTLLKYSEQINGLVSDANKAVNRIGEEMDSVVKRGDDMGQMTVLQAQRAKAITKLAKESAQAATLTVEGAGNVVRIMGDMTNKSEELNEQVKQFKIQ